MAGGQQQDGRDDRREPVVRQVITRGPEQTRALGRRLGARAEPGQVFALSGPLGAGKTELARGLLGGMGVPESEVLSPTFTLIHEHLDALAAGLPEVAAQVEAGWSDVLGQLGVVVR